jgi:hypothetical protein
MNQGDIQTDSSCISLLYLAESYKWIVPITLSGLVPIMYSINLSKILLEQEEDEEFPHHELQVQPAQQPEANINYSKNMAP